MFEVYLIKTLYLAAGAYLSIAAGLFLFSSAWLAFAIYHGFIFFVMLSKDNRQFFSEIFAGWQGLAAFAVILFGLSGGLILYLLAPSAGVSAESINPILSRFGLTGWSWLAFVFYHIFVNPFFEELFWRSKLGSNNLKPTGADFLFAGYHILVLVWFLEPVFIALAFCILILAGWFWRQMRRKYGGLFLPIISHMAADGSIMTVAYLLSRGKAPL